MSKICLSIANSSDSIDFLKLIHKVVGSAVGLIGKQLAEGRSGVFYIAELFLNDHVIRDAEIIELISGLDNFNIETFIMEIASDENLASIGDFDACCISLETTSTGSGPANRHF